MRCSNCGGETEKRFLCAVCFKYHPEMKGVSEEEFNTGNNVCTQERCTKRGEKLDEVSYCKNCDKILI